MAPLSDYSGLVAVTSFLLFTGLGALAQVHKLATRTTLWRAGKLHRSHVCDGLHPVREMWSFSAFTLFALSGLTRSYTDTLLLCSRIPVIALSTIILWFLQFHGQPRAKLFFRIALLSDFVLAALLVFSLDTAFLPDASLSMPVDCGLAIVSVCLFYGKTLQARTMHHTGRTQAVSSLREIGISIKDATGLWYALSIGNELLWVGATHSLSLVSSLSILAAKILVEREPPAQSPSSATT